MLEIRETARGFSRSEFKDRYKSECSIQDSSLATEAAIWLGVEKDFEGKECTRMHLTQDMVEQLLPLLNNFLETGSIGGQ